MHRFVESFVAHANYALVVILMMVALYIALASSNLIKKLIGLALFQGAIFLLYISIGKIIGGTAPILTQQSGTVYSNPLPQVLILTAIVVGIATMALGLALCVRINGAYGSIEEDEIEAADRVENSNQ